MVPHRRPLAYAYPLHVRAGDDIVIGKTSPIPDDGSGMPQRYSKKVSRVDWGTGGMAWHYSKDVVGPRVDGAARLLLEH